MIRDSDLETAVSQNIISVEQAAKLRAIAQDRVRRPHETNERFVVVNNLSELFVSIGQVLFFIALFIAVGNFSSNLALALPITGIVAGWAMAEFFARNRNMRWPAIVASIAAAACAGWLVFILSGGTRAQGPEPTYWVITFLVVTASLGLAIFRYRLPFLALPLTGALAALASEFTPHQIGLVIAGAIALAIAVALDLRDRERLTRNSAFAFWLYVAGAPLFLHPIYSWVTEPGQSTMAILAVLVIAAASCFVGLLLDRRSPIVASLLYLGIVITWSASAISLSPQIQTALTLFILGVGVMLLGIWWKQARAAVLGILPPSFVRRLPLTEDR